MKIALRAAADWCVANPREAAALGCLVLTGVSSSIAAYYSITGKLEAQEVAIRGILEQQVAQARATMDASAAGRAELREFAEMQRRWQDKSEARDDVITKELRDLGREISSLKGYMQRAASWQGWRFDQAPEPTGTN